jgi:hypothetical protein
LYRKAENPEKAALTRRIIRIYSPERSLQQWEPEPFIRLKEIVKLIARVADVECKPKRPLKEYTDPNENPIQGLLCEDTKQKLQWSPAWDLEQGIGQLLQWYRPETTRDQYINLITELLQN